MRHVVCTIALSGLVAAPAFAQIDRRIPIAVFDARAFTTGLNADTTTAENLEIPVEDLPTRGLGGVFGAHVYPLRRTSLALGLGGEFMFARGSNQPVNDAGRPVGDPVGRRLQSFSVLASLNFGHRDGFSYLTGGMGPLLYQTHIGEPPPDEAPRKATMNMGGGARWFFSRHLAFGFDVRFYLTRPEAISGTIPGRARQRLLVLSAGLSIR